MSFLRDQNLKKHRSFHVDDFNAQEVSKYENKTKKVIYCVYNRVDEVRMHQ